MRALGLTLGLLLLPACGGGESEEEQPVTGEFSVCDPLDEGLCAFPFPSTFYMREDSESESGWRLDYRLGSLPAPRTSDLIPDPALWNERDGVSPLTPIMTFFEELSLDGVIGHDDLGAYLDDDVKSVIVDVETGERIPHFVELDMSHNQDDRRALILHPVEPMRWGGRYVVGLRGLERSDGGPVEVSSAFASLRDSEATRDYDIEGRRELYDEVIFPTLEATGFEREELQLAWDFVVASKEGTTGKALFMRDDMLARLPDGGPTYRLDEVVTHTPEEDPHIAKRLFGVMTVPYYTDDPGPNTLLSRDESGMPFHQGDVERPFTVLVPHSLHSEGRSGPILQYGHGLMGSQGQVESGFLEEFADEYGYVLLATDWTGMSGEDVESIIEMIINEIDRFPIIPERSQQGIIEMIAAMEMMTGDLANDPELMVAGSDGEPISVVDVSRRFYYGNSQGGILGTPYLALSPSVDRGVLGVGGGPYSLLLPRSVDFDGYFILLKSLFPDYMDISLWIGLWQVLWDSAEPSGYLDSIAHDPLGENSPKQALIQVAIGDAQVTTLGAHIQARGIGAGLIAEPTREVWGLDELPNGAVGSGLVEWDYGLEEPFESIPPDPETDPHGTLRKEPEGQEQMHHFFATGELVNFCDGPCVVE